MPSATDLAAASAFLPWTSWTSSLWTADLPSISASAKPLIMTLDCFKSFTASLHLQNQVQTPCCSTVRGPVPAFVSTHSVTCDLPASQAQLLAFLNKPYSATTQCPLVLNAGFQESCPHHCYHHVYFCTSSLSSEHPACISWQFSQFGHHRFTSVGSW